MKGTIKSYPFPAFYFPIFFPPLSIVSRKTFFDDLNNNEIPGTSAPIIRKYGIVGDKTKETTFWYERDAIPT